MMITARAPRRGLLLLLLASGCNDLLAALGDAGPAPPDVDGGAPSTPGRAPGKLSAIAFAPSNFAVSALEGAAPTGDLAFNGMNCGGEATLDTDKGTISCAGLVAGNSFWYGKVKQGDGGSLGVFVTNNLAIEPTVKVKAQGQLPLVIVALDSAEILGTLSVAAKGHQPGPGGFAGPTGATSPQGGQGPGAGAAVATGRGAGGGFCGKGGAAGASAGGASYGAPELAPLIGGSSGGLVEGYAGGGGGAVQVIAANAIRVGALGVINAGGGGGVWRGCGGGSGGAIMLESPSVTVAGVLAANGGGGADTSLTDGSPDGLPGDQPAPGGPGMDAGGNGAAGATVDGAPGMGGGGGGGTGFIRINSRNGMAAVTGKVSPAAGTRCTTQGTLK